MLLLCSACRAPPPVPPPPQGDQNDEGHSFDDTDAPPEGFVSADVPQNATGEGPGDGTGGSWSVDDEFRGHDDLVVLDEASGAVLWSELRGLVTVSGPGEGTARRLGGVRLPAQPLLLERQGERVIAVVAGVGRAEELGGEIAGSSALLIDVSDPTAPVIIDHLDLPYGAFAPRSMRVGARHFIVADVYRWQESGSMWSLEVRRDDLVWIDEHQFRGSWGGLALDDQHIVGVEEFTADVESVLRGFMLDPEGHFVEEGAVTLPGPVSSLDVRGSEARAITASASPRRSDLWRYDISDPTSPRLLGEAIVPNSGFSWQWASFGDSIALVAPSDRYNLLNRFDFLDDGGIATHADPINVASAGGTRLVAEERRLLSLGFEGPRETTLRGGLLELDGTPIGDGLDAIHIERPEVGRDRPWPRGRLYPLEPAALDGQPEPGLVAVPSFVGPLQSELQLLTFSADTIHARARVEHPGAVRGVSEAGGLLVARSKEALQWFDISDPDQPASRGELRLVSDSTDLWALGDGYAARRATVRSIPWGRSGAAALEVIALDDDPDQAPALGRVEIREDAEWFQVGSLLVGASVRWTGRGYRATMDVHDFGTPTRPRQTASFVSDALNFGGFWGRFESSSAEERYIEAYALGDALVFPWRQWERRPVAGARVWCTTRPENDRDSEYALSGQIVCVRDGAGPETCTGELLRCPPLDDAEPVEDDGCEVVDPESIPTVEECFSRQRERTAEWYHFDGIDLSDPAHPRVLPRLSMDPAEEAVSLLPQGDHLLVSTRRIELDQDLDGPSVRFYVQTLSLRDAAEPVLSTPINLPGEVVGAELDVVWTHDRVWEGAQVRSVLRRVRITGTTATIEASLPIDGRWIEARVDQGRIYVLHALPTGPYEEEGHLLIVGSRLAVLGDVAVSSFARINAIRDERVALSLADRLFLLDVREPQHVVVQGVFRNREGAGFVFGHAGRSYVALGPYGLQALGANERTPLLP